MAQVCARTGFWPAEIPFDIDDLYTIAEVIRDDK